MVSTAKKLSKSLPFILGKEFDCINKIISKLPTGGGIGDDCAVIDFGKKKLLISTDSFIESVHFDMDYFCLDNLGERCLEASLSDIAAMGGRASYLLLSLSVPDQKLISGITKGIKRSLIRHGVRLIGGDTTYSKRIYINCTVIGESKKVIFRSGAKPGDGIYISSYTGLSAGGMFVLKNKASGFKILRSKHLRPIARLDISEKIARKASAMIDISDGLLSELHHIAYASRVSMVLEKIPIHKDLKRLEHVFGVNALNLTLSSGEDFELLYTMPKGCRPVAGSMKIGSVIKQKGKRPSVYSKMGQKLELLKPSSFKHF